MANQVVSLSVQPRIAAAQPGSKIHGRIITTKVVGVTFEDRQEVVARVQMGDRVWLEREPDNLYDPHAIKVTRSNGEEIGYLNRNLASNLGSYFDRYGKPVRGKVTLLTGGSWNDYSLGLVISFKVPKLTSTQSEHQKHQFNDWDD